MAVPKIRFPEFSDEWRLCSLEEILTERNVKQTISEDAPLLSFTIEQGVINPEDKKTNKRDFLMKDKSTKTFALTEVDDIIYNPANLKFGAIHRNKLRRGVVSPIYAIFYTDQNPAFVEALVRNPRFIKKSLTYLEGSVIKLMTLKPRDFVKMQVYLPSIEEQRKIAELLSKIDNVIALCQAEIKKTQEFKRGLLQKMFPKAGQNMPELRFPGFTDAWEQRELGEVTEDFVEKSTVENQYPVLTSSQQKGIVLQDDYFAGDRVSQSGNLGYFIIPRGYFAYRSRSDNDVFVFNRNDCVDMGIISYFYPVFKPKNVDSDFLLRRLNNGLETQLRISSEGTGQHVLSLKKFKNMTTLFPTISEQQKIGAYFKSLDNLITLHQRNSYGLHLPQGLYPSAIAWS